MENSKVIKITNRNQFEALVRILEKHPDVAKGQRYAENCMATNYVAVWDEITQQLNSLGPPVRDALGWQKVWCDLKLKTKKKLAHNKKEINATGGGPNKLKHISPIEQSVASLLSLDRTVNCPGRSFGIPLQNSPEIEENQRIRETDEVLIQEQQIAQPSASRKKTKTSSDFRKVLLEKQSEKTSYLTGQIKDIKYDLRKFIKLQEEKLKIERQREEREKAETSLKRQILLSKKRKLEMELSESDD